MKHIPGAGAVVLLCCALVLLCTHLPRSNFGTADLCQVDEPFTWCWHQLQLRQLGRCLHLTQHLPSLNICTVSSVQHSAVGADYLLQGSALHRDDMSSLHG